MSIHGRFKDGKLVLSRYGRYRHKVVEYDGISFDSVAECRRYKELKMLEKAGYISKLGTHKRFKLEVNGIELGEYEADFDYYDGECNYIIEDVKAENVNKNGEKWSTRTDVYKLKKKLMKALYGIEITEVIR